MKSTEKPDPEEKPGPDKKPGTDTEKQPGTDADNQSENNQNETEKVPATGIATPVAAIMSLLIASLLATIVFKKKVKQ